MSFSSPFDLKRTRSAIAFFTNSELLWSTFSLKTLSATWLLTDCADCTSESYCLFSSPGMVLVTALFTTGTGGKSDVRANWLSAEAVAATSAESAAQQILRAAQKRRPRLLIGPDARVIDWIVRLFPAAYTRLLGRRMDQLAP